VAKPRKSKRQVAVPNPGYGVFVSGITTLLETARHATARMVNGILTATYWEVGRRIVEFEQGGKARAGYGEALLKQLAQDLTARCGRGFSKSNLFLMRAFYLGWQIFQTPSGIFEARATTGVSAGNKEGVQTVEGRDFPESADTLHLPSVFPLPWSHYVRLLSVENLNARRFYEAEALRGAGQCGNSTGRSARNSTSGQHCRGASQSCWPRGR